jgi:hypothetical protein
MSLLGREADPSGTLTQTHSSFLFTFLISLQKISEFIDEKLAFKVFSRVDSTGLARSVLSCLDLLPAT